MFEEVALPIILISVLVIALVLGLGMFWDSQACNTYKALEIDVQWHPFTGCMANHPKLGWMPADQYFNTLNINVP